MPVSSTTVFLAVGLTTGPLGLGLIDAGDVKVERAAEVALFAILFTDGQHASRRVLTANWRAPLQGCDPVHANQFLAAFVAGATIATIRPQALESFPPVGEWVSELVKGGALLAFACLVDARLLGTAGMAGAVLAIAAILVARPLPALTCLLGPSLALPERMVGAWFGPKGFASVAAEVGHCRCPRCAGGGISVTHGP
jgi:NhaP-type Na+/H+ or K+/H+ antiporter